MNSEENGEFVLTCFVWRNTAALKCKHPQTVRSVGCVKRIARF
jgi:hypothetical protein